jgi:carboxypeptidase Taq
MNYHLLVYDFPAIQRFTMFVLDVRITTRYSKEDWLQGLAGTVHEVGHALYEQGRNTHQDCLPVSRPLSMGIHESQSLFWEKMIFQSEDFWYYMTPIVHKYFSSYQRYYCTSVL